MAYTRCTIINNLNKGQSEKSTKSFFWPVCLKAKHKTRFKNFYNFPPDESNPLFI
jgi:hypothetical protein